MFRRNTLTEVICQLRFPPILQIGAEVPVEFQNRVRNTYPEYEKETGIPGIPDELRGLLSQMPIQLGAGIVHRFTTDDHSRFIALAEEYVAVSERHYERWEAFNQAIGEAMQTTEAVYEPASYSRIGLRYQNTIDRTLLGLEQVPWSDLLQEAFAGILTVADLAERIQQKAVQFLIKLDEPDNSFVTIRHGLQPREADPPVYVIDADFFTTARMGGDNALDTLGRFHEQAGHFFRWTIKDRLHQALEPEAAE